MIYDKIDNIEFYKGLSQNIALGLDFLKQMKPDTAVGTYQINHRVKVIVSEYETKMENEFGYEAHKKYIDIQYLLLGEERIACLPIERLKETNPYNEENDAAFYAADLNLQPSYLSPHTSALILQPSNFSPLPSACRLPVALLRIAS